MVPPDGTEAVAGETVTTTGLDDDEFAGTEMPEQPARKSRAETKVTRIVHWQKFTRCERRLFLAWGTAGCNIQTPLKWGFPGDARFLRIL